MIPNNWNRSISFDFLFSSKVEFLKNRIQKLLKQIFEQEYCLHLTPLFIIFLEHFNSCDTCVNDQVFGAQPTFVFFTWSYTKICVFISLYFLIAKQFPSKIPFLMGQISDTTKPYKLNYASEKVGIMLPGVVSQAQKDALYQ